MLKMLLTMLYSFDCASETLIPRWKQNYICTSEFPLCKAEPNLPILLKHVFEGTSFFSLYWNQRCLHYRRKQFSCCSVL